VTKEVNQVGGRIDAPQPQVQPPRPRLPQETAKRAPEPKNEASTSYEAMLKETYDGDNAEVMNVVNAGRRTGEDYGDEKQQVQAGVTETPIKTAPMSVPKTQINRQSDSVLSEIRNKPKTVSDGGGKVVGSHSQDAQSVKASHDQLMLTAGQMGASEAATFISYRSFLNLSKILSQQNWVRQIGCEENLNRTQMAVSNGIL
jgi:hypothetical protein